MKSAGQVRYDATIEERQRLNKVIDTQIELLWERVATAKTDDIKSAWTIAILELTEVKKMCNYPVVGIHTEYKVEGIRF
jgi:uncharacterized Zn finger protein